jgi:hypothetical protein
MSPAASWHRASGKGSTGGESEYGITVQQLRTLMEHRADEAREKIDNEYGGTDGLCQRLKTDPNNGIPNNADEIKK